jgi:Ras-related protein Rab-7A
LEDWKQEFLLQSYPRNPQTFPFVVMGNKADVCEDDVLMSMRKKATTWCGPGIPYYETSAKENTNVEQAFYAITELALKNEPSEEYDFPQDFVVRVNVDTQQPIKKCSC